MMKKLIVAFLVTLMSVSAYGAETISRTDITSWDGLTVSKYNTDLNTVYTKINSGIYGSNIVNDTLSHDDFGENSRLRPGFAAHGFSPVPFILEATDHKRFR